jgi:hypothetical protein
MRFPSIGLIELAILAGVAALVMLAVAAVVVVVVRRRRGDDTRPWKWIAIVGSILVLLPLLVVVLGVLLITPARVERSPQPTSQAVIVAVEPDAAPEVTLTTSEGTLIETPSGDTPLSDSAPVESARPDFPSIVPDTWLEALAIPIIIAALVVLLGAAIVALVLSRWSGDGEDGGLPQSRAVLLALTFWTALSLFLVLDLGLGLAVSVYFTFVVAYAAFWVLVGALLLYRRPLRERILILALFVVALLSVRFVDWNSRKPFLRGFNRVKEGMTESQVDRIMDGYIKEYGGGPPPSLRAYEPQFDEQGRIITGWVTYRHTDEGWGDSDWGEVTFENGRVVEKRFLHD